MKKFRLIIPVVCLIFALLFLVPSLILAGQFHVIGDQVLTVSTSAQALTPTSGTERGLVCIQGDDVLWRAYTTDPTSTIGAILGDGDCLVLESPDEVRRVKFILRSTSSAATIYVIYEAMR